MSNLFEMIDPVKRKAKIEQIKALFNKTIENNATEEEATAATEMAAKLMAKYEIDYHEVQLETETVGVYEIGSIRFKTNKSKTVKGIICVILDEVFNTKTVLIGTHSLEVWGVGSDLDLYFHYYQNVIAELNKALREYKKTVRYQNSNQKSRLTQSFHHGFLYSIFDRLDTMNRQRKEEMERMSKNSLCILKSKSEAATEECYKNNKKMKTFKAKETKLDRGAYTRGKDDGEDANLTRSIK